jgi:hypothetical protein
MPIGLCVGMGGRWGLLVGPTASFERLDAKQR